MLTSSGLRAFLLSTLTVAALGAGNAAHAAGFYIQEQSIAGLGAAFSGAVTNIRNASTIYFNPAGLTKVPGRQIQFGAHLLVPSSELTDTGSTIPMGGSTGDGGNPYDPTPIPNVFISHQINDSLWAGIGVSAPFGLANDYEEGWFGRYDSTSTDLSVMDVQPTIAWKACDWFSIGAGLNVQHAKANLKSAVTNGVTEGVSELNGDDYAVGYNIGIQVTPLRGTTFGVDYRSAVHHRLEGQILVTGVAGLNRDEAGHADLDLPDIATFGVSQSLGDKVTLMGQATWFGWNNFESIAAITDTGTTVSNIVQNYQTTWAFALGIEYDVSDKLTLRTGVQFDETPTTDEYRSTRTPDGDRTWVSFGGTYALTDRFDLDFAATYIDVAGEEINVSRNAGLATVQADTDGHVGILAAGLIYKF